jgi:hypothetical protein
MLHRSTYSIRRLSARHRNLWLPLAGLFAFILVKGIVPVGLMPGSLASGSMYTLCHDDLRSIALFDLLAAGPQHKPVNDHHPDIQQHHGHHGHIKMGPDMDAPAESPAAAHDYPDGNCNFANSFAKAVLALSIDFLLEPAVAEPSFFLATRELFDTAFIRPLTRAPPLAAAV